MRRPRIQRRMYRYGMRGYGRMGYGKRRYVRRGTVGWRQGREGYGR